MAKLTKATGIALVAASMAIGTTLLSPASASAKIVRVCTTIPAHDITVGGNPRAYPPRPGRIIHVKERTVCTIKRV